jgi:metallophosphoesterase superfamily enzyme
MQLGKRHPCTKPNSEILNKLTAIISKYKPDRLVILGDVKYTVVSHEFGEWQDIPDFFHKLESCIGSIAVVRGNHDANIEPLLPENVELLPATGAVIGDVGVFHGHKWPSPALLGYKTLVMGHLHPVVVFRDPTGCKITRQVWMKAKCDTDSLSKILLQKSGVKIKRSVAETLKEHYNFKARVKEIFIMPSFNDFLGGRPINETRPRKEIGARKQIWPNFAFRLDVDNSELHLLDLLCQEL